jgi:type II secretory pathway component GspD/PulD (secretin)
MQRRLLAFTLALLTASLAAVALPARAQEGMDANTNRPERVSFTAWSRGRDAERAGKPEEAFAAYSEALRDEPGNPEYRADVERMRFALAESFANQAERAILADNPVEAATLLRRALSYDPQNEMAHERLRQLERHAVQETTTAPEFAAASPQLAPQPGSRDFNYRGPARGAYLDLARQFGLLALFDDDATNAQIRFQVSGVDFRKASDLLGEQTGTFLRALDSRTFLVVNDTQQKRREYMPQIERTLLLPESEKPEQMNEIVRAVRDVAGLTHTQFDTRSRTLTVRGAERDVALATALVRQLEQPRGEVMLEIDLIEVDRNSAETLGFVPPSSAQIFSLSQQQLQLAQQSTNGLVQVIQALFGTPAAFAGSSTQQISSLLGSGATSLSALVPPLLAFGGGQTIWLYTLPGATANFASQLSAVLSAQRILLRAEDGEPASFFVGERYPINFSTLSNEFTTQGATAGITEGTLPTGASPRGVATAVLRTSSSFLDVITANHDAGTVSVSLGNGNGSFQTNVDYRAGTNPVAVSAATFRTAGQPVDLAVVDQGTNNVQILLGNGDGTFRAPVAYPVGTEPSGLVLGDFNGDGIQDIAVTNFSGNSVSLLFGNGDGTFKAAQTIALANAQGPIGIAAADFNGDGHTDLAVANSLSNNAALLLNDPINSITRSSGTVTATLSSPLSVPGGNGVGRVNVIGVGDASFNGTFVVLSGSGTTSLTWAQAGNNGTSTGGLAVVQSDLPTGTRPVAIVAAGFNSSFQCPGSPSQAHPDLAVANQTDGTVTVFLNQCNGTFSSNVIGVGNQPDALLTGDFNNDSQQDLVVANSADGTITVLFGSGTGTFPANIPLQTSAGITCSALPAPSVPCQGLASGDFNGDGLLDAAVTDPANNTVTIIINSQQLATQNAQLPYPGFQYEDIGVKAKATPHIHPSGDVTLALNFEIRSLSAVDLNGIPILSNRTIEQTVRLRPDEPSVVSGIFSDQTTLAVTGTPGALAVPGLDYLLGNHNPQEQQTELVVMVTPRLVRLAPRTQEMFYVGHERQAGTPTGGVETPEAPVTVPGQPPLPGQPPAPVQPFVPPGQTPPEGQPPTRPRP